MSIVANLYDRLRSREQEREKTKRGDVRQLIKMIAESEDGAAYEIDENFYCDALESAGMSAADIQANIDQYKMRLKQKALADQCDKLQAAAVKAEQQYKSLDLEVGRKIRELHHQLEQAETVMNDAIRVHWQAVQAHGDLIAGADTSDLERELGDKLAGLNSQIRASELALDKNYPGKTRGNLATGNEWASLRDAPAYLLRQTEQALRETRDKSRRRQLESQLATAGQAVSECEKRLHQLRRQRDEINKQLAGLGGAKLLPENFRLQKLKPDREQLQKQLAAKLGYGTEVR